MADLFQLGNKELKMSDATYAVDTQGMENYIKDLKTKVITDTKTKLEDVKGIQQAVDKGWNGPAKNYFLKQLQQMIRSIEHDLDEEANDLNTKLRSITLSYIDQNRDIAQTIEKQSGFIRKVN